MSLQLTEVVSLPEEPINPNVKYVLISAALPNNSGSDQYNVPISSGDSPITVDTVRVGKIPFIEYLIQIGEFDPNLYATSAAVDALINEWSDGAGIEELVTYRFDA